MITDETDPAKFNKIATTRELKKYCRKTVSTCKTSLTTRKRDVRNARHATITRGLAMPASAESKRAHRMTFDLPLRCQHIDNRIVKSSCEYHAAIEK